MCRMCECGHFRDLYVCFDNFQSLSRCSTAVKNVFFFFNYMLQSCSIFRENRSEGNQTTSAGRDQKSVLNLHLAELQKLISGYM